MIAGLAELAVGHWRRTLLLAGALFLLAAAFGVPVVSILKSESSDFQSPSAQNQQVLGLIERVTGQRAAYGLAALVPSNGDVRTDVSAQHQSARVTALLARQPGFQRAIDYPATHLPELVSRDGRQTLVLAAFATRDDSAHAVEHVRPQLLGAGVRFGGNDMVSSEITKRTSSDLERAEMFALPILLLLSFWVFRGLVAAALPLLVGGFAIVATFLALRLIDHVAGVSVFAINLVSGMGLGLGIDYSLFVLSRYREELTRGLDTHAAILRTLQTSGRTVLYSSLTVAGALASLLVFPLRFLYSMGIGGSLVALADGAIALIVLPAVLMALGGRVDALAPKRLQRRAARTERSSEQAGWFRLARWVMRRPGLVAVLASVALIAVASPSLRLTLVPSSARVLPSSSQARQVAETLSHGFPVDASQTITMLVRAPAPPAAKPGVLAPRVATIASLARHTAGAQASEGPPHYIDRGVWEIELQPRATAAAPANQRLVKQLRALDGRSSSGAPELLVGGETARFVDQKAAISADLPLALTILTLVTAGFLFLMTGSLILPLLALVMNVLTVAVGAGLLVLIFQDGHLGGLIGFRPIGGLEEDTLVLLFVAAFALSTDYGVFQLGRIKEAHDAGLPTRDAVARGLERMGRLITAAALLFCVAIGALVMSHLLFVKQLGVGAALAVAVDATVVRALLVPALMGCLGELTWWAPRPLRRLHARIGLSEGPLDEAGLA